MTMLILNGSPKANREQGNTQRFIKYFTAELKKEYEVCHVYKENPRSLASKMKEYDTIIMVMPLYIHSMPSGVKALIDELPRFDSEEGKKIGFIVQFGFPEGYHAKWLCDYFKCLAKRLNCHYLGTVVRGDCAFISSDLDGYKPLFEKITALGKRFGETGEFDKQLMEIISMPYLFDQKTRFILKGVCKLGIVDRQWKKQLRANKALRYAKDQPFLKKC